MTSTVVTISDKRQTVRLGLNEQTQYTRSSSSTGAGGWQIVDRPRNKVATEWTDFGQWQLTMNLILGGREFGLNPGSVEAPIRLMESWEAPAKGSTPPQPPTLRITGPVPHTEVDWIIYTQTWGDCIRDVNSGARTYQELQLVLWEYLPPTITLTRKSPAKDATAQIVGAATATTRRYTVKGGDTLTSIAAAQYSDWQQWTAIASANGLRSPTSVAAGQIITLP
jgi:LysM repeat protein